MEKAPDATLEALPVLIAMEPPVELDEDSVESLSSAALFTTVLPPAPPLPAPDCSSTEPPLCPAPASMDTEPPTPLAPEEEPLEIAIEPAAPPDASPVTSESDPVLP
jgi:hypothetical protein